MESPQIEFESLSLTDLPDNSFLVLRIDVPGPMEKHQAVDSIMGELRQYRELMARKKITILLLTQKENLEVLTEREMNQAGWFRKSTE
jgi:hypothetical protein